MAGFGGVGSSSTWHLVEAFQAQLLLSSLSVIHCFQSQSLAPEGLSTPWQRHADLLSMASFLAPCTFRVIRVDKGSFDGFVYTSSFSQRTELAQPSRPPTPNPSFELEQRSFEGPEVVESYAPDSRGFVHCCVTLIQGREWKFQYRSLKFIPLQCPYQFYNVGVSLAW